MAMDKFQARIEAKIDALLVDAGLKPADFANTEGAAAAPRTLSKAEAEAIANAPAAPAAVPAEPNPLGVSAGAPGAAAIANAPAAPAAEAEDKTASRK